MISDMTKIVYILNSTYITGGATKSFLTLLEVMISHGLQAIVVVPDHDGVYQQLVSMDVTVFVENYRPNTYPHVNGIKDIILFLPRLIARKIVNTITISHLYRQLKNEGVSLIHTNVSIIDIGYRLAKKLEIPHIYHIREYGDLDFKEYYFPTSTVFHKLLHGNKSYAIAITKTILSYHRIADNPHAKVIYNGISQQTTPAIDLNEKKNFLLYAGRIEPSKGLLSLLEAFYLYRKKHPNGYSLYIAGGIGSKKYMATVMHFIKCHQLTAFVTFLGNVNDIDNWMRTAKALIVVSYHEAFGRSMAEAMLNHCLVIGRNTDGTKEQFDNGLNLCGEEIGWRFSDTNQLTEKITLLETITNEAYQEITTRAYNAVRHLYTKENYVSQIQQFYAKILNE